MRVNPVRRCKGIGGCRPPLPSEDSRSFNASLKSLFYESKAERSAKLPLHQSHPRPWRSPCSPALLRQSIQPFLSEGWSPWSFLRIGAPDIGSFERKIAIDFTVRDYQVKTIESPAELKRILGLRRSVFHSEFARKWISLRSDFDQFDLLGDHLAIFDRQAGKVAGAYRVIPSAWCRRKFYSSTEFDIEIGSSRRPARSSS